MNHNGANLFSVLKAPKSRKVKNRAFTTPNKEQKMNWIELIEQAGTIAQQLEAQGGEDPDDMLAAFIGALDNKIEGYYAVIERLNNNAALLRKEERRIKDRRQALEAAVTRLKSNALALMAEHRNLTGERRLNTGRLTASIRTSKAVEVDDGATFAPEFMREEIRRSVDKIAIKAAIQAGETIDGARLVERESVTFTNGAQ